MATTQASSLQVSAAQPLATPSLSTLAWRRFRRHRLALFGATLLTALNDNALITYLATLVPDFTDPLKLAVVQGAVTGGGLTVIANAPNPAGQALLARFFDAAISPFNLLVAALVPTLIATVAFRFLWP